MGNARAAGRYAVHADGDGDEGVHFEQRAAHLLRAALLCQLSIALCGDLGRGRHKIAEGVCSWEKQ